MTTHVRVVAGLFLLFGGALLIGGAIGLSLGGLAMMAKPSPPSDGELERWVLGLTGAALTVALLTVAIPALLAGWGLLRAKRWARTLGIVLAAISLVNFWIGTIFGAYALWVLLNTKTEEVFGD